MSSLRTWVWRHRRAIVGTSLAAAGTYAAYVVYQKKRQFDAICAELLAPTGLGPTDREQVTKHGT